MIVEWKVFDFTLPTAFSFKESKKCFKETSVLSSFRVTPRALSHPTLSSSKFSVYVGNVSWRAFFAPLHIWIRLEFASKMIYTVAINGGKDIGVKFTLASNLLPGKLVYSH